MRKQIQYTLALIVATVALAILTTGCGTTRGQSAAAAPGAPSIATENTQGGYHKAAPYYSTHRGVLYAWDGSQWWYLRKPFVPMGHIRGAPVCQLEDWVAIGGSHVRKHQRTPLSFRNQSVKPVFSEY